MFHSRHFIRAAALAAATLLSTAAFAQVTFNRGNDGDPETLDVQKGSTVTEAHLMRDLYEGLMIHNAKGDVVYGVAASHTESAGGTVFTFKLRPNAKWSNGDDFKASDYVFAFRRIINPDTGAKYANILYPIKNAEKINKKQDGVKLEDLGVKAIDDKTLEITLERPTPYFLELLTHQTGYPVHEASVRKHGNDYVKPENWVSNGAYRLVEWTPNSHIRLDKNPHFHDAANVQIERIMYYPTPDFAAASRRFMAGELHFTTDIPADQTKFLKERLGDQVKIAPYLGTYYLAFNMAKKPFDDRRVRQALSMAIDREFIAEQIWGGTMVPGTSFVPPASATTASRPSPTGPTSRRSSARTWPRSCWPRRAMVRASRSRSRSATTRPTTTGEPWSPSPTSGSRSASRRPSSTPTDARTSPSSGARRLRRRPRRLDR